MALAVKNLPDNAGDVRDPGSTLGGEDALEEDTASHSSIPAQRIPMDGGALRATVHRVAKSRTGLKQLSPAHKWKVGGLTV